MQTLLLSEQVRTKAANLVLQATLPGVKKLCAWLGLFLDKCASITVVDLIQPKKIGS